MKLLRFISLICILLLPALAYAQGNVPNFAYVNASQQLVITNATATARWIVTNPGEAPAPNVALNWSPDGTRLLFAIGGSVRVADVSSQRVTEVVAVDSAISGAKWSRDGQQIILGLQDGLYRVGADGANPERLIPGGQLTSGRTISADGRFLFFYQGSGFAVTNLSSPQAQPLPGRNNLSAASVGLWSDAAPFVAYWGFSDSGTSALGVANAANGETVLIDSGTSVPVAPLAWVPGTTTLLYRSALGVSSVDVGCLGSGCGDTPSSINVLPVDASRVSTQGAAILYTLNGNLWGAPLRCVSAGDCTGEAVSIGQTGGGHLLSQEGLAVYTAPDNRVYAVDTACVASASCEPLDMSITGAARAISNGYVLVENGSALTVFDLNTMRAAATLSGIRADSRAVWNQ